MFELCPLQLDVDGLGLSGFQLALGGGDIGPGVDALSVTILGDLQKTAILFDHLRVELLFRIGDAERKISLGEGSLQAQTGCGQVGGAGFCVRTAGLGAATNPTPEIELPGSGKAGGKGVADGGRDCAARGGACAVGRTVGRDRRKEGGSGDGGGSLGFAQPGFRDA